MAAVPSIPSLLQDVIDRLDLILELLPDTERRVLEGVAVGLAVALATRGRIRDIDPLTLDQFKDLVLTAVAQADNASS